MQVFLGAVDADDDYKGLCIPDVDSGACEAIGVEDRGGADRVCGSFVREVKVGFKRDRFVLEGSG